MRFLALLTSLFATAAFADPEDEWAPPPAAQSTPAPKVAAPSIEAPTPPSDGWDDNARFFGGVRMGVAIPAGGTGIAPTLGLEMGVSAKHGFGFGLHIITMQNPPAVPTFNIPKADWGLGALADVRMYFQSVEPLTLYATLSGGFLAGPGSDASTGNVVLPMINPGFGARVKLTDSTYVAFEFGLAAFYIPFVNICFGWEPPHHKAKHAEG